MQIPATVPPVSGKIRLLTSLSFLSLGLPRVVTTAAATALFLRSFGAEWLPAVYIATALLAPAVNAGYLWLQKRASPWTVAIASLGLDIAVLVISWSGINSGSGKVFVLLAMLWIEVEYMLSNLVVWGLAGRMVNLREGKTVFGRIGAGRPVAMILGGLATPLLLGILRTSDLLLISAAAMLGSIALILALRALHGRELERADPFGPELAAAAASGKAAPAGNWLKRGFSFGGQSRYVHLIFAVTVVAQMPYFFINTAFAMVSQAAFPQEATLAGFLALFTALVGAADLVFSVLLSGNLMRKFGVGTALLAVPAAGVASAAIAAAAGVLPPQWGVFFPAVAVLRLSDEALYNGLCTPAMQIVFQPLPPETRTRAQAIASGYMEPITAGLSGLGLVLLSNWLGLGALGLTLMALAVFGAWVPLVRRLAARYGEALAEAFRRRRISTDTIGLDPAAMRALATRYLRSEGAGETIYALSLLEQTGATGNIPAAVATLAVHQSPVARRAAMNAIARLRLTAAKGSVAARLKDDPVEEVRAAALRALAVIAGEDAIEVLAAAADDPSIEVRIAAFTGLMLDCGIEGTLACGSRFLEMHRSHLPQERFVAARILDGIASPSTYRLLIQNMTGGDLRIRRLALRSAGHSRAPQLWPYLLDALASPSCRATAAAALAHCGEEVLPSVLLRFDSARDAATRARLVWIAGHIGTPPAIQWLLARASIGTLEDRWIVTRSLNMVSSVLRTNHAPPLWGHVLDAAECIGKLDSVLVRGDGNASVALRAWVLQARIRQVERLLTILSWLLPRDPVRKAARRLHTGSLPEQAIALEMIETLLPRRCKAVLLAAIDPGLRPVRADHSPVAEITALALAEDADGLFGAPIQAAALLICHREGPPVRAKLLDKLAGHSSPVVSETARRIAALSGAPAGSTSITDYPMLPIEKMIVLRSVPAFSDASDALLADLAAATAVSEIAVGDWLIREGDFGDRLFVIVDGEVSVLKEGALIRRLGPGDVVGEMAVLDPEIRSASVRADSPGLVMTLDHDDLDELIAGNSELAQGFLRILCERLREASKMIVEAGHDKSGKLAALAD